MQIGYQIFSCPLGELLVAGTPFAVTNILLGTDKTQLGAEFLWQHDNASSIAKNEYVKEACQAIAAYLHGENPRIDVAIQLDGTEFQRKVWSVLRQIPYGHTISYSAVAGAIGDSSAVRAVANACADNPVPLIVPCHRVIHKNGDITGFSWGKEAKRWLLDLEKTHAPVFMPGQTTPVFSSTSNAVL